MEPAEGMMQWHSMRGHGLQMGDGRIRLRGAYRKAAGKFSLEHTIEIQ